MKKKRKNVTIAWTLAEFLVHCQSALWILNSHLGLCWFGRFYCKYVKLCVMAFSASCLFCFLFNHLTCITLHDTGLCTVNQLFSLENVCVSKEMLIMVIFMLLVGWWIIVSTVYLAYVCKVIKQFAVLKIRWSCIKKQQQHEISISRQPLRQFKI